MLQRAVIVGAVAMDAVAAEFPSLALEARDSLPREVVALDSDALFAGGAAGWAVDRALDDARAIALRARDAAEAIAILTRLQRLVDRRNAASASERFDAALARHGALYDLAKPLVRADHDHARDAWQWLLRLDASASQAAQLAILFHDVERLATEADARIEQRATDYDAFKRAHAAISAAMMRAALAGVSLDAAVVDEAAALVAAHDQPVAAASLINDADALSFFSLNAGGYLDYFGPAQTRKKIAWTLARLSPRALPRLDGVRLRDDVRALFPTEAAA